MQQIDQFDDVRVEGARVALVAAPYYREIVEALLQGARAVLERAGAGHESFFVPGALEIPLAIACLAQARGGADARFDGYIGLGCVIRGETSHYETVSNLSAEGLMQLGLAGQFAISNAILTVENPRQASVRADPAGQDKGGEAARACLALIALRRSLAKP